MKLTIQRMPLIIKEIYNNWIFRVCYWTLFGMVYWTYILMQIYTNYKIKNNKINTVELSVNQ